MRRLAPVLLILLGLFLLSQQVTPQGCSFPNFPINVTPSPIPDAGNRVLITFNNANKAGLPKAQLALLSSNELRTWLDQHCVKDSKGIPEWRIWPVEIEVNPDQPIWQKLMGLERKADEWIIISTGKTGYSGPLPADEPATMELLKKYLQ